METAILKIDSYEFDGMTLFEVFSEWKYVQ